MHRERFIFEPIEVDVASIPVSGLGMGAPTCPMRFRWRGREVVVARVIEHDKQLRAHDSREKYLRTHSFRVLTEDGYQMVLRCDRQIRGNPWRVFTVSDPVDEEG